MSDLDTEVEGEPGSIRDASDWLQRSAATSVADGALAVSRAREEASLDWGGDAGPAFAAKIGRAHGRCARLEALVPRAGAIMSAYADDLQRCQQRMAEVCADARAAGLQVDGHVVRDPGPGPARPPDRAGEVMPIPELERYEAAVRDYNRHQEKREAFNAAVARAGEVRADLADAQERVGSEYRGMDWEGATTQGIDWVAAAVLARAGSYRSTALRQTAAAYARDLDRWSQQMRAYDYQSHARLFGDDAAKRLHAGDVSRFDDLAERRATALQRADDFDNGGRYGTAAKNISRGLVGVGIVTDLMDGESTEQALASNVGGYVAGAATTTAITAGSSMLAATATGAALGSAVPVVGTAVGAVVGLGVGLFASGAIDSMFENGPDVGKALDAGAEAVTDTVGAIGDGFKAAGDFVGGLF